VALAKGRDAEKMAEGVVRHVDNFVLGSPRASRNQSRIHHLRRTRHSVMRDSAQNISHARYESRDSFAVAKDRSE
jgi:hypothetical protein